MATTPINGGARVKGRIATGLKKKRSYHGRMPQTVEEMYELDEEMALSMNPKLSGLPVFWKHGLVTSEAIGKIVSASIEDKDWIVEIEFSDTEQGKAAEVGIVKHKLFNGLSLQHRFNNAESWDPLEVSFCPKGARPGTTLLQGKPQIHIRPEDVSLHIVGHFL